MELYFLQLFNLVWKFRTLWYTNKRHPNTQERERESDDKSESGCYHVIYQYKDLKVKMVTIFIIESESGHNIYDGKWKWWLWDKWEASVKEPQIESQLSQYSLKIVKVVKIFIMESESDDCQINERHLSKSHKLNPNFAQQIPLLPGRPAKGQINLEAQTNLIHHHDLSIYSISSFIQQACKRTDKLGSPN